MRLLDPQWQQIQLIQLMLNPVTTVQLDTLLKTKPVTEASIQIWTSCVSNVPVPFPSWKTSNYTYLRTMS